jgi:hypothetical protein
MTCRKIRPKLPGYLDGGLAARDHAEVARHLSGCVECRQELDGYGRIAALLARTARPAPPAELALRLRLAVDEARQRDWWLRARHFADRVVEDWLAPLSVPATGGVAMSLLVYALVLHTLFLGVPLGAVPNDRPLYVVQPARLQTLSVLPSSVDGEQIPALNSGVGLVEFTINAQGQAVSYEVLSGQPDRETLRQLDHFLLFSRFHPQLSFGRPTAGGRVVIRFDEFHVKG